MELDTEKLVCRYFNKGFCYDGFDCLLPHIEDRRRIPDNICRYYWKKKCWFGQRCRFWHICVFQKYGRIVLRMSEREKSRIQLTLDKPLLLSIIATPAATNSGIRQNARRRRHVSRKESSKRSDTLQTRAMKVIAEENNAVERETASHCKLEPNSSAQHSAPSYAEILQNSMVSRDLSENNNIQFYVPNCNNEQAPNMFFAENQPESNHNISTSISESLAEANPAMPDVMPNHLSYINLREDLRQIPYPFFVPNEGNEIYLLFSTEMGSCGFIYRGIPNHGTNF